MTEKKIKAASDLALHVHTLVDQVHALIGQFETKRLAEENFLRQIQSICGVPDPATACRIIIETIDKYIDEHPT